MLRVSLNSYREISKNLRADGQISRADAMDELIAEVALLNKDARWLSALEQAGVDNWEGISEAAEILEQWNKEDPTP